jgi:hypothetical protein
LDLAQTKWSVARSRSRVAASIALSSWLEVGIVVGCAKYRMRDWAADALNILRSRDHGRPIVDFDTKHSTTDNGRISRWCDQS